MIIEFNENSCLEQNQDFMPASKVKCYLKKDHEEIFHMAKFGKSTISWPVKKNELHKTPR